MKTKEHSFPGLKINLRSSSQFVKFFSDFDLKLDGISSFDSLFHRFDSEFE